MEDRGDSSAEVAQADLRYYQSEAKRKYSESKSKDTKKLDVV